MPEPRPQLLGHVGGDGRDHEHQRLRHLARHLLQAGQVVVEHDQACDRRVDAQVLVLGGRLLDGAGQELAGLQVGLDVDDARLPRLLVDDVAPQALQEAQGSDDGARVPGTRLVQGTHRHLVETQRVRAVLLGELVGGDDVLQGLAHLAVLLHDGLPLPREPVLGVALDLGGGHVGPAGVLVGEGLDVALVEEPVEGLHGGRVPEVEEDLLPEAGVQQVQHRVLHAPHVQVDAAGGPRRARPHPVGLVGGVGEGPVVVGVRVADLVGARTRPVRHRVRVAVVGLKALTEVEPDTQPFLRAPQGCLRFGVGILGIEGPRREVVDLGQGQGQHLVGQGVDTAVLAVDHGEGLPPVALAGEEPVTQPVRRGGLPQPAFTQPLGHRGNGVDLVHTVQVEFVVVGVHEHPVTRPRRGPGVETLGGGDGRDDVEVELAGEGEVTLVVGGHGHDGARPVSHEDVVGHEDGDRRAVDRVHAVEPGEHTGLLPGLLGPLLRGLRRGHRPVGGDGLLRGRVSAGPGRPCALGPGVGDDEGGGGPQEGMLGGHHHEGGPEEGVGTGRVDLELCTRAFLTHTGHALVT